MHHPTDRIAHTTGFVTPVVEHWLEREIAQWRIDPTTHRTMSECSYYRATFCSGSTMKDRSDDPSHHEPMLYLWAKSRTGSTTKDQSDNPSHHERTLYLWAKSRSGSTMKDQSDDPSHHERTLYLWAKSRSGSTMKDQSDDPSHHEQMLLPRSYVPLALNKRVMFITK